MLNNRTTNPLTYGSVAALDEVHGMSTLSLSLISQSCDATTLVLKDIGEIWANMLHNMLASLVDAHGFSSTARTDPTYVSLPSMQ